MIRARFRALVQWLLRDPSAFWGAFVAPCLILWLAWQLPGDAEWRVRVAGYSVTFMGVLLVVHGVQQTQQMFGRPRYKERIVGWLERFPSIFKSRHISVAVSAGTFGLSGSATAIVRSGPKDGSISARLRAVEDNVRRIDDRITGVEQHAGDEVQKLRDSIAIEQREREQRDTTLGQKLEQYSTGSLDVELVGVAWVMFGQAFSSFPSEIASWFA